MTSKQIRQAFLDFFKAKDHFEIPPANLVLENDPSTLFTSSGMQPLVPYLIGEKHPKGARLINSQAVFRAEDIEEVGDSRHTSFFEMLGNWSLGDYYKREQLSWVFEFLTEIVNLPKEKLYVSVFEGNEYIHKDNESEKIWLDLGVEKDHIFFYGEKKNWWSRSGTPDKMPVGEIGGPDSEIFFKFDIPHNEEYGKECHLNCDCGRFLELGNCVFIQYQKIGDNDFKLLPQKNVDFGGGLERLVASSNNEPDIFKGDLYQSLTSIIEEQSGKKYEDYKGVFQVLADHIKAATFLIISSVKPSNKMQGYILRRLIRRSMVKARSLSNIDPGKLFSQISLEVLNLYDGLFGIEKVKYKDEIENVFKDEVFKFQATLDKGLKEIEKVKEINGKAAFDLYQTFGFPLELTEELFIQKGQTINKQEFQEEFEKHKNLSKTTSAGVFKGGLTSVNDQTTKYHTATHLLHQALREILGPNVIQHGSNITPERLRFDFSQNEKLTDVEIKKVQDLVQEQIKKDLVVSSYTTTAKEALNSGAIGAFQEKYIDPVTVYSIGDFSKEICGGPHVEHTGVLGKFKIQKQESISSGVRRVYAILQPEL